jgi:hypothetical protein
MDLLSYLFLKVIVSIFICLFGPVLNIIKSLKTIAFVL